MPMKKIEYEWKQKRSKVWLSLGIRKAKTLFKSMTNSQLLHRRLADGDWQAEHQLGFDIFSTSLAEPAIFSFLYTIRAAFGWENQGDNATFLFLFHPWWVDLWVVLRGDPCTQSQQPATLKEKKGKGYRSLCNLTNQLLFGRKTKVHCKLRVKKSSRHKPLFAKFAEETFMLACNSCSPK